MSTDRIEKRILLKAPLERVWRAVSDAEQFGHWFGIRFDGPFVAGATVTGTMTPTAVDDEVARTQEPYAGMRDTWEIVAVDEPRRLAFRWHPYGGEDGADNSREPTTLVEFTLAEEPDGVLLTVVESGFDALPAERRTGAFEANSGGWAIQVTLVQKYLALAEAR